MPWGDAGLGGNAQQPHVKGPRKKGGFGSGGLSVPRSQPEKKGGHHGVLGFVENLGTDVGKAVVGLGPGLVHTAEHPIRTAKQIGTSYKDTYGPLTHGDLGKFLHNLYEHPLGPILDVATIVTLGSAAGAKAGIIPGEAEALTLRSPAARLGQADGRTVTKLTSHNPAIRARQKLIHNALNRLPAELPLLGETVRFGKEIDRLPRQEALRARLAMREYKRRLRPLSDEEIAAIHLIGRGVHPEDWSALIRAQPQAESEMLRVLDDPKIIHLVENPTKAMEKAIPAFHDLSLIDRELKISHGFLTHEGANDRVMQLANEVGGEKSASLRGQHEPFYVPDVIPGGRVANADFAKMGGGAGVPKVPGGLKHNKGVLARTGRLALHPDVLGPEYLATIKYGLYDDIHSELMSSAVRIANPAMRPRDWVFIPRKITNKFGENPRPQQIHALDRRATDIRESLSSLVGHEGENLTRDNFGTLHADAAETLHGDYLIVPKRLVDTVTGEFHRSNTAVRWFFQKPTHVWRALVLGFRVGFLTNNVVGTHLIAMLHAAGIDGLRAYLNAIKREKGMGVVRTLIEDKHLPDPLRQKFMEEFFPEQVQGTFGGTQRPDASKLLSGKKGRKVRAASVGLVPATQAASEGLARRALVETFIRKSPQFKKVYRAMPAQTRDFEAAAAKVMRGDGGHEYQAAISRQVNRALGDYLGLNSFEQNALRSVIPFYAWYKAITTITLHLAADTPGRANLLSRIGQIGSEDTLKKLGSTKDYLEGLIPLGGPKKGQQEVLSTGGLNPFQTDQQLLQGLSGILAGKPGATGKAFSQLGPNPILLGILENMAGKRFFTGHSLKSGHGIPGTVLAEIAQQLPQTQLLKAQFGHGRPSTLYGKQSAREAWLQFFGAPLKQVDLRQAKR